MDPFIGEIRLLPYSYVPQGWLACNGQTVNISLYTALFAICGARFGGNGTTNFALPNLNGLVPQGYGSGPGLAATPLGQSYGADEVALGPNNYPAHSHTLVARDGSEALQAVDVPSKDVYLSQPKSVWMYTSTGTQQTLADDTLSSAGTGTGQITRTLMQPYLAMCYCICWDGIFAPRP